MITAPENLTEERQEQLLDSRVNIKRYSETYPELRDFCVAACYYELPFYTFIDLIDQYVKNGIS